MKSVTRETLKLLGLSLVLAFILAPAAGFHFSLFVFCYAVSLLILPYWIKCDSISIPVKVLLALLVGLLSVLLILHSEGVGRPLYSYLMVYGIAIVGSSVIFLIASRKTR